MDKFVKKFAGIEIPENYKREKLSSLFNDLPTAPTPKENFVPIKKIPDFEMSVKEFKNQFDKNPFGGFSTFSH